MAPAQIYSIEAFLPVLPAGIPLALLQVIRAHRWEQFQALMDERESKMLRAYTSLHVSDAGNLELGTLKGGPLHTVPVCAGGLLTDRGAAGQVPDSMLACFPTAAVVDAEAGSSRASRVQVSGSYIVLISDVHQLTMFFAHSQAHINQT